MMDMVVVSLIKRTVPTQIDKFLGLNEDTTGETQLKLGESPYMVNWQITENYKLRKRTGYIERIDNFGDYPVQGLWCGKINGTEYFIFARAGKIIKVDPTLGEVEIGTLTDAKTFFFAFSNKLYILNGYEYKYYDGTTFGNVAGYRPKIVIGTPPSGGIGGTGEGKLYEQINVLTGAKHQTFSADGIATEYQLAETNIDSVDFVKVNGVLKTVTTDYTVNLTTGKVTFVAVQGTGQDNVDIGWTKGAGQRDLIVKCKAALLYGGANDTRVFVWGNSDYRNRRLYTGLADGVPSAEYFPANYFSDVGSSQYAITDIVKQHDRQIIFTEINTFYSYLETVNDEAAFPVYPLNDSKGNVAFNQARIINNNPYSVFSGVYEWISTQIRDEKNARYISKRVQKSLDNENLNNAITFDYEAIGEYWLCIDNKIWIHNYRIDVWYYYELTTTPTCFVISDGDLFFGTTIGKIMKFDEIKTDSDTAINAVWEMGFYDWGAEWLRKYLSKTWITLKPSSRSSVNVSWETNIDGSEVDATKIEYNLVDYSKVNYSDWTYQTSYNPQPFTLKTKAKKFVYFKLRLTNHSITDEAVVLSINMLGRIGGQSK